jgi:acyl-CoA synthetase (AMP-forming)/AMP-acid ligase II
MSVDYLSPSDFVMRPRLWLTLMSRNKSTISFSPPLGYELALKRINREHIDSFDLSNYITGRKKDMIIINGRNIWPQDIEYLAEIQPEVGTGNASAFSVRGRKVTIGLC